MLKKEINKYLKKFLKHIEREKRTCTLQANVWLVKKKENEKLLCYREMKIKKKSEGEKVASVNIIEILDNVLYVVLAEILQ